ncbi:DMT family transporter [Salinarimonas rosea]|uniref:DMT family transporter n=1 Tax=Salinarimonas rosea TaxID=552063 RepID=UPI00041E79E9|nr:DMT family transporter [Salinarimonas rosea]
MPPPQTPSSPLGALIALAAASFYGLSIVIARLAADAGISGVSLVFWRTLVVVVGVVAFALLTRRSVVVPRARWPLMTTLVVSSVTIAVCYISAIAFVPVTVAAVIFYTFPVLIVLASPIVEGRRLGAPLVVVAIVSFVGVACVVGPAFSAIDWRGVALAGVASVGAATQFFAGVRARDISLTTKVFWMNTLTLPASLVIALSFGVMNPPGELLLAPVVVALGVVAFVLAFTLQFVALGRAGAVASGLSFCIEPVVAAFGAALLVGERLSGVQILGVALVVAAIAGNVLMESRRAAAQRAKASASRPPTSA